jgi:hypothetical protein
MLMSRGRGSALRRALLVAAVVPALASGSAVAAPGGDPELAAEAPTPEWTYEGGGAGGKGGGVDPHVLNKKIRRAGRVTIAGGSIAIAGGITMIAGAVSFYFGNEERLKTLREKNGYHLPVDDPQRHRIIAAAEMTPLILGVGAAVLVTGIVTAAVAHTRLRKLREQRRTSLAFGVAPRRGGGSLHLEVRF